VSASFIIFFITLLFFYFFSVIPSLLLLKVLQVSATERLRPYLFETNLKSEVGFGLYGGYRKVKNEDQVTSKQDLFVRMLETIV